MEQKLKNNIGLAAYATAQLGRPYWYGTFGQTASPALLVAKRSQYPRHYTANDFPRQYGQSPDPSLPNRCPQVQAPS